MSAFVSHPISPLPTSWRDREKQETSLGTAIDDLAVLRFSIVLTAKWEFSGSENAEDRTELHTELINLRRLYSEKLDQIAMTFGVQRAMNAKEEVEGTFTAARRLKAASAASDAGQLYF